MKLIPLTQGKFAIVDDRDFEYLMRYKWCAILHHGTWYAMRSKWIDGKCYTIRMHREIFLINNIKVPNGIDHKDNNGLNNQKNNLRPATNSQNNANRRLSSNNSSGYKGVTYHRRDMKFCARIGFQDERIWIGYFDDPINAAVEYDRYAKRLFKDYACLNFSEEI
jgi:hypothetical protein